MVARAVGPAKASSMNLDDLRDQLTAVDRAILELVARRNAIATSIGARKQDRDLPTRDFSREREVLDGARSRALELGLDPSIAERLLRVLIESSLTTQEEDRVAAQGTGGGRTALVLGGAGKMGRWFCRFLSSQGYRVAVADPHMPSGVLDHDVIVVASALRATNVVLHALAERHPRGLVFDVGSLKSPLRSGLRALADAGVRVASIHPMFGPETRLLSGRHVVCCGVADPAPLAEVRALFAPTMAILVDMDLDEHDRVMAYVLGLSHAVNLAFITALGGSGELAGRLSAVSSTTFDAQLALAARVAEENPELYFDIQALNDYGEAALESLEAAVAEVHRAVASRDADGFRRLFEHGRAWCARREDR